MPAANLVEQLVKYLADAHAIETQALAQLRTAPDIAEDPGLESAFREHLEETEGQERLIRERLEAHGGKPSPVKEAVMAAGGKGFILFARSQSDTPGKLTAHALSYEALEFASYELLMRVAERAGDPQTAEAARTIRDEEHRMMDRLEGCFDGAAEASLAAKGAEDAASEINGYLADAHAIEAQALQLLDKARDIGGDTELQRLYAEHLEETRGHQRLLEGRLQERNAGPSKLKDAAMRAGALNWAMFFGAQPDTPGKLAAFAFAFEHLEIGGYELLKRVAAKAGDTETIRVVDEILAEERSAADKIAATFDRAAEASLEAVGA
ncbi:MAG: DUF892 family protein [Thermoleophilaceae bacterium]